MRPIHEAKLDKVRPVLVLTRELVRPHLTRVTVAPITTTIRGLSTEVAVGRANGLDADSVINCDSITTIPVSALGQGIGYFFPAQEESLSGAIRAAFDLE
ncbi:mRNA interferase MazF3 [Rhodococcus sp. SRB_17]|nr:mRNA interferase MazF3 [Rhodococcus sp. SRB_17]NMM92603.1 mRNA interferase MazF3 [Rhodococcus sp. SRB_17]